MDGLRTLVGNMTNMPETKDQLEIAYREASQYSDWSGFGTYCALVRDGLRESALKELSLFIESMENRSFTDRKQFVAWFCTTCWQGSAYHTGKLCPYPLKEKIILPTLREWVDTDPASSKALRWLAEIEWAWPESIMIWKKAIDLDKGNIDARVGLLERIIECIDYAVNDSPGEYLITDPHEDLRILDLAEGVIRSGVPNAELYAERVRALKDAIGRLLSKTGEHSSDPNE